MEPAVHAAIQIGFAEVDVPVTADWWLPKRRLLDDGPEDRYCANVVVVDTFRRVLSVAALGAGVAAAAFAGLVTAAISMDLGLGRRLRPLGPQIVDIDAPREVVFDIISQPYLGRQTHALAEKVRILERSSGMVLAAHYTPVWGRLVAKTVETVRFTPPERVDFRLVRGPVPHVVEEFLLIEQGKRTRLEYRGEMGTDLSMLGQRWGEIVARRWEKVVAASIASVKAEAERRASSGRSFDSH